MAFRPKFLALATVLLGLASPVNAAGLSAINAFSCAGQGNGLASQPTRENWTPEYYRSGATFSPSRDTASTVKLRIIYEMGNRMEIDHCGGTVIDSNWVVTAGHCVAADLSWDRVEIIAGDENLDGGNTIKRITRQAVCHAGFRYRTLENDIALLHVDNPFPARITPVAMDREGAPSLGRGELGIGHGWPVTGVRAGDRHLNRTNLQVHDVNLRSYITTTNASSSVGGLCRGESGGPIMSNGRYGPRIAGVLSGIQPGTENRSGDECMLGNYEMYFTPIAAHRNWIDTVKSVCDANPGVCGGSGSASMAYASATPPQPTYQTATYVEPAKPTYINIGDAWDNAAPVAAAPSYHQPATPTYIHTGPHYGVMAPIHDGRQAYAPVGVYEPAPVSTYGTYNVAYARPAIIYGSAFPHHAR